MAGGQKGNTLVNPLAHKAMDNFKYEIAAEMGLPVKQGSEDYWGQLSSRDCGAVGGEMVRRMVQQYQMNIVAQNQKL
ncbi:MAG: alpha/beta-type small acid-soluble spore protein [Halanaerobiales bacterium]|nr:alpha/beta-type small acid-soluble spore protein [Halanaerobiales bacterium]